MTEPAAKKPKPWIGAIKYVIGFALLGLVLALNWNGKDKDGVHEPGLVDILQRTPDYGFFALVFVTIAGVVFSQYVRWYFLVKALDFPFKFKDAVRLGMVGTFYNTFLPGAIGGDIVKAVFIAREQPGRKTMAVSTVIADRLLGLFGLLVFAGFFGGAMWLAGNERIIGNPKLQYIIMGSAAAATVGALGFLAIGFINAHRFDVIRKKLKKDTLQQLWLTMWTYRQRPLTILLGVGLSAIGHSLMMLAFHFSVQIFPPENLLMLGSFTEHCVIAPIGYIIQAVVPLPGGVGVSEFTFGGLYEFIRPGGGKVVGLTGRLAMRVVEWILGAICYIVFLNMKRELPTENADG
jgi:glycosyltransferase 2 family protein